MRHRCPVKGVICAFTTPYPPIADAYSVGIGCTFSRSLDWSYWTGISQKLLWINIYQGSLGLVLWKCAMNSMSVCRSPVSWSCIWWNVRRSALLTWSTIRELMTFIPRLTDAPCLLCRLIAETCRFDFKCRQNCSMPWWCLHLLSASQVRSGLPKTKSVRIFLLWRKTPRYTRQMLDWWLWHDRRVYRSPIGLHATPCSFYEPKVSRLYRLWSWHSCLFRKWV